MLIAGFICLAFGIGGGLLRLGWNITWLPTNILTLHGPLIVCGFLGAVISLERAVAIGQRWAYFSPSFAAVGGITLIAGLPWFVGVALMCAASAILSIATAQIFYRQRAIFTLTLLLGSLSWLIGNLLLLYGFNIPQIMPWWISFLVLTIAAERLELSRFLPPSYARFLPPTYASNTVFITLLILCVTGTILATRSSDINVQTLSVALFAIALWLLKQDIARHTIKKTGLTRFVAVCLLSGYLWLLVGALVGLTFPQLIYGSSYDAFLHAIFVGFVFSMIFGHAPIIFSAIVKVKIPYHPTFYLPLIALNASLIIRIFGDILLNQQSRHIGGMLSAIALLMFVLSTFSAIIRGKCKTNQKIKPP
jgi:hypothetical protein